MGKNELGKVILVIEVEYDSLRDLTVFQNDTWGQVEEVLQEQGYVKSAKATVPPQGEPLVIDLLDY